MKGTSMNELYHYGTKNMKWGVRRYQYEDKSLTPEGRIHYGVGPARGSSKLSGADFDGDTPAMAKARNQAKQAKVAQKAEKAFAKNRAEREKLQAQRKDILEAIGRDMKDWDSDGYDETIKERDYYKKLYNEEKDPESKKFWKEEIDRLNSDIKDYDNDDKYYDSKMEQYTKDLSKIAAKNADLLQREARQSQKFMNTLGQKSIADIWDKTYSGFEWDD